MRIAEKSFQSEIRNPKSEIERRVRHPPFAPIVTGRAAARTAYKV
jgi:hypothetical protein